MDYAELMEKYAATRKPYLRLRQVGNKWSIVRVRFGGSFGQEIVAEGLTRKQAEQMIALTKEE